MGVGPSLLGNLNGHASHDLLPLPHTEEALTHVVRRVRAVQDFLQRPLVLENISTYVQFRDNTMTPWEFIAEVAKQADCKILFDVNNAYVSAKNHGLDPIEFVRHLPVDRVAQIHLAGHCDKGTYLLDTHDGPVCDAVWALYAATINHLGPVSTLIEWDDRVPDLGTVMQQARIAKAITLGHTQKTRRA